MEESPVDLSQVVWISRRSVSRAPGDPDSLDPAHLVQAAAHDRGAGSRFGAVTESTRAALGLVERLVHELQPLHRVRHQSEVRHFVWCSFADMTDTIDRAQPLTVRLGRVRLRCGPGRLMTDPWRYEADGRLHLPASAPDLPVRLVVEPWWSSRTAITLSLRPSRRIRYPRRYFDAAHGVMSELAAATS